MTDANEKNESDSCKAMSKVAFFTVVYPAVEFFFADFLRSLERQSFLDFDLVIVNDGLRHLDLRGLSFNTRIIDCSGSPAEIRETGFNFLHEQGYKLVIFGDSDDYFSHNRVETNLKLLQTHDLIVNDLNLVDESGQLLQEGYLSQRLCDGERISADFIRDKNIFGLSNTAVSVSLLPRGGIPAELVAVDWFVFATILEGGGRGVFSASTNTFYRQHGANTVGFSKPSSHMIFQAVKVKALHYESMSILNGSVYRDLATAFRTLYLRLLEDAKFRNHYFTYILSNVGNFPFWWENALLPEDLS